MENTILSDFFNLDGYFQNFIKLTPFFTKIEKAYFFIFSNSGMQMQFTYKYNCIDE